jgi:DNA-binding NtrC family response regulator
MSTLTSYKMVDAPNDVRSTESASHLRTSLDDARLLIIDADPAPTLNYLRDRFMAGSYIVEVARTGTAAIERISKDAPGIILLDPHLPDQSGLELHRQIREIDPRIPVIFLTMDRTADAAIGAMKQGAYDLLFKPLEEDPLEQVLKAALHVAPSTRSARRAAPAPFASDDNPSSLCGTSPKMREVFKSIGLVAAQDVNVLITGESGTGKELVARAIYQHSARSDAPFLALNCAAIPENLLESELFGHEKGAFSGADRRRIGKFEQYSSGTILLDEIGDMPLSLQAKILRLLQEQTFERVGGNETIRTNVRIIASTHRDLKNWSAQEKFRSDLYYRLSVFTIHLPPLRERMEDLPMLVQHFLRRYSREMRRQTHGIAADALEKLEQYSWPGNIRELQSVLKQALLRSTGELLLRSFLPPLTEAFEEVTTKRSQPERDFDIDVFLRDRLGPNANNLYADLHRELDRHSLARVMKYTRGNRHMASRVLGIARQTLRLKLRESGLHITQNVEAEDARGSATTVFS